MKKFIIFILILAAIYAAVKLSIGSPDESIPLATSETSGTNGTPIDVADSDLPQKEQIAADRISANYSGYGPGGKEEHGSVTASSSTLARDGAVFSGGVTFDMGTITSTPVKDKLIEHLKSADFFDVAKHPTATFTITSATASQVQGTLTMKGIAKPVTLPLAFDSATNTFSSTVRVNMEDFGITQVFTDKEFVLTVTVR